MARAAPRPIFRGVTITCSKEEAEVLARALDDYTAQLRIEASRTEPGKLAREMWDEERILTAIRERLPR